MSMVKGTWKMENECQNLLSTFANKITKLELAINGNLSFTLYEMNEKFLLYIIEAFLFYAIMQEGWK